ncbi:MAG: 4-alpha-glucanotransferase [Candidatus Omnitrophica bacterium]|nr:4-alpha-glucanotransferase [Candidatus Omnitrophota bacterium]
MRKKLMAFIALVTLSSFINTELLLADALAGENLCYAKNCLSPQIILNKNLSEVFRSNADKLFAEQESLIIPQSRPTDNAFNPRTVAFLAPLYSLGRLGKDSRDFADSLAQSGVTKKMDFPTTACQARAGDPSPYGVVSVFAREASKIDLCEVFELNHSSSGNQWLKDNRGRWEELFRRSPGKRRNGQAIAQLVHEGLKAGFEALDDSRRQALRIFRQEENKTRNWLDNYALFMAISDYHRQKWLSEGKTLSPFELSPTAWTRWEKGFKEKDQAVLKSFKKSHAKEIEFYFYEQFITHEFLRSDADYHHRLGISLMGDMPIYVSINSVDAWWEREKIFLVDKDGNPLKHPGAAPDYFSEDGQNWALCLPIATYDLNPEFMDWMQARVNKELQFVDELRIDHARWFQDLWLVKVGKRGIEGKWTDGLWLDFLKKISDNAQRLGKRVFAEDLGSKINAVVDLLKKCGLPGMKVLVFAVDQGDTKDITNSQKADPHHRENFGESFLMVGTHDTRTWKGVWQLMDHRVVKIEKTQKLEPFYQGQRKAFMHYLAQQTGQTLDADKLEKEQELPFEILIALLDMALGSNAETVVIPIWDILGYGEADRINVPGFAGDWGLLLTESPEQLKERFGDEIAKRLQILQELIAKHQRGPKQYRQTGKPQIVGTLPNIANHVPQTQQQGEDFEIFTAIQGSEPREVWAITNLPAQPGQRVSERRVKMHFLQELPSGARLYGVKIKATESGPWWLNFEADGMRSGEPGANTSLFVTREVKYQHRFAGSNLADNVGLVVNWNDTEGPFEIYISNYNEYTLNNESLNAERSRQGYLHFRAGDITFSEANFTHLNRHYDFQLETEDTNLPYSGVRLDLAKTLGINGKTEEYYAFIDRVNGEIYLRSGQELLEKGLFFSLPPEGSHRFVVQKLKLDLAPGLYGAKLSYLSYTHRILEGKPVENLRGLAILMKFFGLKLDVLSYGQILSSAHLLNLLPDLSLLLSQKHLDEILDAREISIAKIGEKVRLSQLEQEIEQSI